jgi:hypothetical protein
MNLSLVLASLFFSFFPAVFITVGSMFLFQLVTAIPFANARKRILLEHDAEFLTEESIERELARRFPTLYNLRLYAGFIMLGTLVLIYIVSFFAVYSVLSGIGFTF